MELGARFLAGLSNICVDEIGMRKNTFGCPLAYCDHVRTASGELTGSAGLNFGPLLLLGTCYIQTHQLSVEHFAVGIPLGVLTAGILYVNEFPDLDADTSRGREHLVARWDKASAAARLKAILGLPYIVIVASVVAGVVTPFELTALASVPKALMTSRLGNKNYDKVAELIPGMSSMVMTTLLTGALLFAAYVAAGLL